MTPMEKPVIERKLDSIRLNLKDIQTVSSKGLDSYLKNGMDRKIIERSLQLVIEAAVDINLHILREEKRITPDSGALSFEMMAQNGFLTIELAKAMAPSVGLRNRIVHEYDILESEKVFEGAKKAMQLFPQYISVILKLL